MPAGIIQASLVGGVLSLTGDDFDNSVTLKVTGTNVTLTPNTSTTIDDLGILGTGTAGNPVVLAGAVTSLKAALKGGVDSLDIDGTSDFVLTGAGAIDLGDGDGDTLNLVTSGKIGLGSLAVKAGDGSDNVQVQGGPGKGSQVVGASSFAYGVGASSTTFQNVDFPGTSGVKVTASEGDDIITLTTVNAAGPVTATLGNGRGEIDLTASTSGAVALSAADARFIVVSQSTISGNLKIAGTVDASSDLTNTIVTGALTIAATRRDAFATVDAFGVNTIGGVSMKAGGETDLTVNPGAKLTVAKDVSAAAGSLNVVVDVHQGELAAQNLKLASLCGNVIYQQRKKNTADLSKLTLTGSFAAKAAEGVSISQTDGTATALGLAVSAGTFADAAFSGSNTTTTIGGKLSISGASEAVLQDVGKSLTVVGDVALTSKAGFTLLDFITTAVSEIKGSLTANGGPANDVFSANQNARFDKNITLTLKDGVNQVTLGSATPGSLISGNLTVTTGPGNDTINLRDTQVTGATKISMGAGSDNLTVEFGATFTGTFSADLAAGDDQVDIAQATGSTAPVTFQALTTIKTGAGNDTLFLGDSGGDQNTKAVFAIASSVIDGGAGLNLFDGLTPTQDPSFYVGLTAANFLHWTDPNP